VCLAVSIQSIFEWVKWPDSTACWEMGNWGIAVQWHWGGIDRSLSAWLASTFMRPSSLRLTVSQTPRRFSETLILEAALAP
jgi:hypothetical protein